VLLEVRISLMTRLMIATRRLQYGMREAMRR